MGLGCGASVAKVVLVVVNTIFLLLGLGIGITGLVFRFGSDLFGDKIETALKELNVDVVGGINIYQIANNLSLLLIIVGFFIFIVGALGCCGACCQNRVLLIIYAVIVILLLIVQIAAVVLFAQFRSSFDDTFKKEFKDVLTKKYNQTGSEDISKSFNSLFELYKCCGVDDSNDIPASVTFPPECCPAGQSCTRGGPNAYPGCYTKLKDQISQYNNATIGVGVSVLIFQLLCVLFAFCLCVAIGRDDIA